MDHPLESGAGLLAEPAQGMTPRTELLQQVAAQGLSPDGRAAGEAWVDDALGAIMRKLKELGLDDNTIVLFTPDHGSSRKSSLFTQDGVGVPMIARWPGRIPAGVTSHALIGNVDWVPTVFEIAGVKPPAGYRLDGHSALPVLTGQKQASPRDHVYLEMGHARGVATREWKYIAVRYPQEQIDVIKRARPAALPKAMSYIGRLGIGVRGADRPGFWDADQLYDLTKDPDERVNLAAVPAHAAQLQKMRALLTAELRAGGRPFGEFVPGGNAAAPGQIDAQIAQVKKLVIRGKTVTVPDEMDATTEPAPAAQGEPGRRKRKNND
jgi:arylsulfatase A-like enzyme